MAPEHMRTARVIVPLVLFLLFGSHLWAGPAILQLSETEFRATISEDQIQISVSIRNVGARTISGALQHESCQLLLACCLLLAACYFLLLFNRKSQIGLIRQNPRLSFQSQIRTPKSRIGPVVDGRWQTAQLKIGNWLPSLAISA